MRRQFQYLNRGSQFCDDYSDEKRSRYDFAKQKNDCGIGRVTAPGYRQAPIGNAQILVSVARF